MIKFNKEEIISFKISRNNVVHSKLSVAFAYGYLESKIQI